MKRIEIGVGGLRQAASAFTRTWERTHSGQRLPKAAPRVDFESLPVLLAALTPRRLELLDVLGSNPGASIRALAGRLGRDYKNVHGDVVAFVALGLIERDGSGRLSAPYDELVIRAPLRLAA